MVQTIAASSFNGGTLSHIIIALTLRSANYFQDKTHKENLDEFCRVLKKIEFYKSKLISTRDVLNALADNEDNEILQKIICNDRIRRILLNAPLPFDVMADIIQNQIMGDKVDESNREIIAFLDKLATEIIDQQFFALLNFES